MLSIFIERYIDFISEANRKSTWTKESIRKLVNQMHIALCGKSVGILFFFHRCCWYCSIIFFFLKIWQMTSHHYFFFSLTSKNMNKKRIQYLRIWSLIYCRCHWYLLWWRRLLDYLNIFHTFVHNFCFSRFFSSFIV